MFIFPKFLHPVVLYPFESRVIFLLPLYNDWKSVYKLLDEIDKLSIDPEYQSMTVSKILSPINEAAVPKFTGLLL